MRKWLRLGLCLGLLTVALTCSALAATPGYTTDGEGTVTYNAETGRYTATYDGTTEGSQYALLVVAGDGSTISDSTIMYIDQKAASADGVSFDFIPKGTPDCVVLLGGTFNGAQSPKVLGTLEGQGATIEIPGANITFAGTTAPNLVLTDGAGQQFNFTEESNGDYVATGVADGTYTMTVSKKSHLTYTQELVIADGAVVGGVPTVKLLVGDVNSDSYINASDISVVLQDYLKSGMENAVSNVNEDGYVNAADISAVLGNHLKQY